MIREISLAQGTNNIEILSKRKFNVVRIFWNDLCSSNAYKNKVHYYAVLDKIDDMYNLYKINDLSHFGYSKYLQYCYMNFLDMIYAGGAQRDDVGSMFLLEFSSREEFDTWKKLDQINGVHYLPSAGKVTL